MKKILYLDMDLVDDWDKHGADQFEGEWIQFGSERFRDWPAVLAYLADRPS